MLAGFWKRSGIWEGGIFFLTKSSKFHHGNLHTSWATTVKVEINFQIPSDGDEYIESMTFICPCRRDYKLIQLRICAPSSSRFFSIRHMTFHELFVRVDFSSLLECITFTGLKDFDLWLPVCKQAQEGQAKLIWAGVLKPWFCSWLLIRLFFCLYLDLATTSHRMVGVGRRLWGSSC